MNLEEIEAFLEVYSPDIQHHADLKCRVSIDLINDYEHFLDSPDDEFAICFVNISLSKWVIKYKL